MKRINNKGGNQCDRVVIALALIMMMALLMSCATLPPSAAPEAGHVEPYTCPDHSFTVAIPKDWEKTEKGHPYGDLTTIAGVRLTGPKNKDGAAILVSILHYSGDGIFPSDREFIVRALNSLVRTDDDTQTVIAAATIAGMPGKTFRIKTFQLIHLPMKNGPPLRGGIVYELAPPSREVRMIQEYIVLPVKKGFFVLGYGAPEDIAEEYRWVFEKITGSFRPHLPS